MHTEPTPAEWMWVLSIVITKVGEVDCDIEIKNDKEGVLQWDTPISKIHKDESIPLELTESRPDEDEVDIVYGCEDD